MLRSYTQDVLEQVTPRSSSRGGALPRSPWPMPNPFSGAITQRGLMKSGTQPLKKGDGAGGGGNQTKGTFYFLPRTRRGREKKKQKTHNHLSILHGRLVALASGPGCPRGDHSSAVPLWAQDLAGSALAPSTALEQQRACGAWGRDIHTASINVS